jgi:cytochrome c peroxidase
MQALVPMFGDDPVELGLSGREDLLLARLKA